MDAPSDIAVIRARLPYTDRRALSAAWYAALRAQRNVASPLQAPVFHRVIHSAPPCSARAVPDARATERPTVAAPSRNARDASVAKNGADTETRRALERSNALKARHTVTDATVRSASLERFASFTVALGDARVRIIARSAGRRLHLTAVCSARHAETVRRALAHATIGLRSCGAVIESTVHCEETES